MRKIRLDDSCLNHLTNIPIRLRVNPHTYIHSEKSHTKKLCILLTGGAYAPYATCIATPLKSIFFGSSCNDDGYNLFQTDIDECRNNFVSHVTTALTGLKVRHCKFQRLYKYKKFQHFSALTIDAR